MSVRVSERVHACMPKCMPECLHARTLSLQESSVSDDSCQRPSRQQYNQKHVKIMTIALRSNVQTG